MMTRNNVAASFGGAAIATLLGGLPKQFIWPLSLSDFLRNFQLSLLTAGFIFSLFFFYKSHKHTMPMFYNLGYNWPQLVVIAYIVNLFISLILVIISFMAGVYG